MPDTDDTTSQTTNTTGDAPHLSPGNDGSLRRAHIGRDELALVLSRYDLGVIRSLRDYPRGSRRSPKVRLRSDRGEFILKRRAPGRGEPERLAFATSLYRRMIDQHFPLAPIFPTRDGGLALRVDEKAYELFEYVPGSRDDGGVPAATASGRTLGRLHALFSQTAPSTRPRQSSFHAARTVPVAVQRIPDALAATGASESVCRAAASNGATLVTAYAEARKTVDQAGYADLPEQPIHGDWHPGNLRYRNGEVVAVFDFDSARLEPRIADVANAALQCSLHADSRGSDPRQWPESFEMRRIRALIHAYNEAADVPLSAAERTMLPWLIIEALIAESVVPIAAHGRFGRLPGDAFLAMVTAKVNWLLPRADRVAARLADEA